MQELLSSLFGGGGSYAQFHNVFSDVTFGGGGGGGGGAFSYNYV